MTTLKRAFQNFAGLCVKIGLYGKELAAIAGSKFKAMDAEHKLVVEFEVTSKGTNHNQLTPVTERTKTLTVIADAGYNSARDIAGNMAQGAVPHVVGTDFDVCVPTEETEPAAIASQKDGRCVGPEPDRVSGGKNAVSVFLQELHKAGGVL
jgi:hypothetical protein